MSNPPCTSQPIDFSLLDTHPCYDRDMMCGNGGYCHASYVDEYYMYGYFSMYNQTHINDTMIEELTKISNATCECYSDYYGESCESKSKFVN